MFALVGTIVLRQLIDIVKCLKGRHIVKRCNLISLRTPIYHDLFDFFNMEYPYSTNQNLPVKTFVASFFMVRKRFRFMERGKASDLQPPMKPFGAFDGSQVVKIVPFPPVLNLRPYLCRGKVVFSNSILFLKPECVCHNVLKQCVLKMLYTGSNSYFCKQKIWL